MVAIGVIAIFQAKGKTGFRYGKALPDY